jgi:hypothetical protein
LWFRKSGHLNLDGYSDVDWASCLDDRKSTLGYCILLAKTLYVGEVRSNRWCHGQRPKLCIELCHKDLVRCCGLVGGKSSIIT